MFRCAMEEQMNKYSQFFTLLVKYTWATLQIVNLWRTLPPQPVTLKARRPSSASQQDFWIQILLVNPPCKELLIPKVLDTKTANTKLFQYSHITQLPDIPILSTIASIFYFQFCLVTKTHTRNNRDVDYKARLEKQTSCLFVSTIKTNSDL